MRASLRFPDRTRAPGAVLAYDIETIAAQLDDGSFPPWPTHRLIAIGFATAWQDEKG